MRICIVTQPLKANYGGILQNYALQMVLKHMGHMPVTIDYIYKPSFVRYLLSICKTIVLKCVGKKCSFVKFNFKRSENIQNFIDKHIIVTEKVHKYKKDIILKLNAKAIIVGSDQVWRAIYNYGVLEDMFLKFAQTLDIKRIAYAASFGIDELDNYTKKQIKICSSLIKKFDLVTVREKSAVSLCEKYFDISPICVYDPTLLLSIDDYIALCSDIPKRNYRFIVAYILDSSPEIKNRIKTIAQQKGIEMIYITADKDLTFSIEEWLSLFRDADFIITDSFHGTVFSIIFNVPFISIVNSQRGVSRLESLLSNFRLENRIIPSYNNLNIRFFDEISQSSIDYTQIDILLKNNRERFIYILYDVLN